MAEFVFVKPAPGKSIRDPVRHDRLPDGIWRQVERGGYWERLAGKYGDVLMSADPPEAEREGYAAPAPVEQSMVAAADDMAVETAGRSRK